MIHLLIQLLFIILLSACTHHNKAVHSDRFEMPHRDLGQLQNHGFSALTFEGEDENGNLIFWTTSDRGPNSEGSVDPKSGLLSRIFIYPDFQPHLTRFAFHPEEKSIKYLDHVSLKLPNGSSMTGLPNFPPREGVSGDELPLSTHGSVIPFDRYAMGIDPEGICKVADGFWISDEYGPALLKFGLDGRLKRKLVSEGYYSQDELTKLRKLIGKNVIHQNLPALLLKRQLNRGFEALGCGPKTMYVGLQSPVKQGDLIVPIIEIDLEEEKVSRVLDYKLESKDADKIGDLALYQNQLLVIEQNGKIDGSAIKKIYAVDLRP